jgi:hypothetical protein
MNRRNILRSTTSTIMTAIILVAGSPAVAAPNPNDPNTAALNGIITNIRNWLMGILFAVAVLFATVGAVRYLFAGGDPAQVEKAKGSFKNGFIGFALAILAPILLGILQNLLS